MTDRTALRRKKQLKILLASAEAEPYIATGGLAQVAGALPSALNGKDADIRIILPMYKQLRFEEGEKPEFVGESFIPLAWRNQYMGIWKSVYNGVTYYFVDNKQYFDREGLYGWNDDAERFAYFSKAVIESINITGFVPDIIHCNDWQTGLVPVYLKTSYSGRYPKTRAVFTIHNLEYQGQFSMSICDDVLDVHDWAKSIVEWNGSANLMKGAFVCADRITTVSPSYAKQIAYEGHGLEEMVRMNQGRMSGILNGIDYKYFDPATDKSIISNYSLKNMEAKKPNKAELQRLFGLPVREDVPVIAMVTRLASHKGIDILTKMIPQLMSDDIQFILLGTGTHDYELFFESLAARYPSKAGISISYNGDMARRIYAGADIFLMPSQTEPCGLSQMIACRYGTIPIVRATGGLKDSIKDCRLGEGNGYVFEDYDPNTLLDTVNLALNLYRNSKKDWALLMQEAMATDFSWGVSAKKYLELYRGIGV